MCVIVYLEKGDNGVEILLVLVDRHVLKSRAPIREASIISAKEDGDS